MIVWYVAITEGKCEKFQEGDSLYIEDECYNDVKNDSDVEGFQRM